MENDLREPYIDEHVEIPPHLEKNKEKLDLLIAEKKWVVQKYRNE